MIFSVNNVTHVNLGKRRDTSESEKVKVVLGFFLFRPKGVGFGQGAGALGMDTGEHLGNKSGSEMR